MYYISNVVLRLHSKVYSWCTGHFPSGISHSDTKVGDRSYIDSQYISRISWCHFNVPTHIRCEGKHVWGTICFNHVAYGNFHEPCITRFKITFSSHNLKLVTYNITVSIALSAEAGRLWGGVTACQPLPPEQDRHHISQIIEAGWELGYFANIGEMQTFNVNMIKSIGISGYI